jgi:hypothetical protein
MKMKTIARRGVLILCVAMALPIGWWVNRQIKADTCLDAGHVFNWQDGKCDLVAEQLPGPTRWYDRLF